MTDEPEMIEVIDEGKIGKKGCPRHYEALGLDPPMKLVPVEQGSQERQNSDGETGAIP